jgi:hypothetical protein
MGDTHELTLPDGRRVSYAYQGLWPEVYGWLIER